MPQAFGVGFGQARPDSVSRTLPAREYKDGSEILVSQGPRRLTPRECARLMGLPDELVTGQRHAGLPIFGRGDSCADGVGYCKVHEEEFNQARANHE
jgi:hypothetical protein